RGLSLLRLGLRAAAVPGVAAAARGIAAARGGTLLGGLPRAAVVGRGKPRAVEVDSHRVEDLLDRRLAAHRTYLRRRVVHALEELEDVPVGTAILVDRH